jgi:hypothetical protein
VPLPFKLLGKLPHWVRMQSPLADQDTVVNAKQVRPPLLHAVHFRSTSNACAPWLCGCCLRWWSLCGALRWANQRVLGVWRAAQVYA